MGSCVSKITITDDVFLTLKSNPNDKLLLSLCLHYDIYDKVSQKKIDELCQISLSTQGAVKVFAGDSAESKKENLSIE